MDWIEELFGISPDAGSGTLEATIAAAVVLVVLGVVFGAARTRREEAAHVVGGRGARGQGPPARSAPD